MSVLPNIPQPPRFGSPGKVGPQTDSDWVAITRYFRGVSDALQVLNGQTSSYTAATLPASPALGQTALVTDATAPTFLAVIAGGGSVVCPVFWNGTDWIAG